MTAASPGPGAALHRHQARRGRGVAVVSGLSGPVPAGVAAWRAGAAAGGRAAVVTPDPSLPAVVSTWTVAALASHDLTAVCSAHVGRLAGVADAREARARLAGMTEHDLDQYLAATPAGATDDRLRVCRLVLAAALAGRPIDPHSLAATLARDAFAGSPSPWARVAGALAGLLPADTLPAVLVVCPSDDADPAGRVGRSAHALAELALAAPAIPVGFAAEADAVAAYLRRAGDARTAAAVREGLIRLGVDDLTPPAGPTVIPPGVATAVGPAAVTPAVTAALADVLAAGPAADPDQDDRARSAAERFLYEVLRALPDTAGLFELNAPAGFRHGQTAAEVDLFAPGLKLAVELDGGYFHLTNRDQYRRDRRKDWGYQRHGYLVLRFLSEDVVPRLGEVLDTIRAAVAHRRAAAAPAGAAPCPTRPPHPPPPRPGPPTSS